MQIRQYAYFALTSTVVTPSDMTARVLVEPDEVIEMGSARSGKFVAKRHRWAVECRASGLDVGELIERVLARVEPAASRVRALVDSGDVVAELRVVRYLDDDDGEVESHQPVTLPDGSELEVLSGQHQLLGWHLDRRVIDFLSAAGVELDVDEYG